MSSLNLKQGFITKEMKQISSAFKTMIRNTAYDQQTLMNSVIPSVEYYTNNTFTRKTTPLVKSSDHTKALKNSTVSMYDFDPNTELHRTVNHKGLLCDQPIVCFECGRSGTDSGSFRFIYLSILEYNWVPVCVTH